MNCRFIAVIVLFGGWIVGAGVGFSVGTDVGVAVGVLVGECLGLDC